LASTAVTKSEGGSSVKVGIGVNNDAKLDIYFSAKRHIRDCALLTEFPEQLVDALELDPANLPDLRPLLQLPLHSRKALLIKRGIAGWGTVVGYGGTLVAYSANDYWQNQIDSSSDISGDSACKLTSSSDILSNFARSTFTITGRSHSIELAVIESTNASARVMAAKTALTP